MRVSVTELDAYRQYRGDEEAELEDLLRQLRKQAPATPAMLAGKAFHKVLEYIDAGAKLETAEQDGFRFRFDLAESIALPPVRELKGELEVQTSVGPVTLVGVVDGIDLAVRDYKLTGRFDAERYADSYQWRCYLLMFGATRFDYDVFVNREDSRTGELVICEYHRLPFYAYPRMREDVLHEVELFAQFAAEHLPERLQTVA